MRCHYVKNKESQVVVRSNGDVGAASLLSMHDDNIEDSEKQNIVSNS